MLTQLDRFYGPWQKRNYVGFWEKPAILFAMFLDVGITTLSNIATKLSFSEWAAGRQRSV